MRNTVTYAPKAANTTRFASNVTGASWALAATTTGDGLAHTVTIHNDSGTDHSGKTATIVGTDENGKAQTETLALPAATATVTSTKHFLTVTSVTPSATIGADTMDIGISADSVSPCYPVNYREVDFKVTVQADVTGTLQFDIEETADDVYLDSQNATWLTNATIDDNTTDVLFLLDIPVRGIRIHFDSVTEPATVKITILQGNNR